MHNGGVSGHWYAPTSWLHSLSRHHWPWPKDAEIKRLNEELATLNRKIQLTIKPVGGHESGTEMKGQEATGESDDTPNLPRKARHVPSMEIAAPSNGLKKIS